MNGILAGAVGLLLGSIISAVAILTAMKNGHSFKLGAVSFAGVSFNSEKFLEISTIRFFENVSKAVEFNFNAREWLSKNDDLSAELLILFGWSCIVLCYVDAYGVYPSEDEIRQNVKIHGAQNCEFAVLFQKVFQKSVSFSGSIPKEFAVEYFLRAPNLAGRLTDSSFSDDNDFVRLIENATHSTNRS